MVKKNITALLILCAAILTFNLTAAAQESESAASSQLTGVALPGSAQRILPGSIPAEISQTLEKFAAAAGDKARQGDSEVLAWAGANYKRANAPAIINRLTDALRAGGWKYEVGGEESGVTVFSLLKERGGRRAVLGFYAATDDALVVGWTEILSAGGNVGTQRNEDAPISRPTTGGSRDIVGTWTNGTMSTIGERNTVTGSTTPSNASTFKYVFTADGRFEFVGLMNSTVFGCTTSLFNDKRGRYEITGAQITLTPSKNFWRNTYSCSPASNKERDYKLDVETYNLRTKTDEYGGTLVCLANEKGESCYRRE